MKRLLYILVLLLLPLLSFAQESKQKYSIEIDARSLSPVQTDELSGVAIDKIGLDRSMRPCARIKMRINRMTRDEISQLSVKAVGGVVEVMRQIVAREGNGFIIELTAKPETRFYLKHPKYGDSNEVMLALEGNKEYRINAELNYLHTIVVSTNVANADVYIDNEFKGRTGNDFTLTVDKVLPGPHKIKVQEGQLVSEKEVEVSGTHIYFRIEINHEQAKPQYVVFKISPKSNVVLKIDDNVSNVDSEGEASELLYNGTHTYSVSATDYHEEKGIIVVQNKKEEKVVRLRPAFGWLTVPNTEELRGAKVYIDGKGIGSVPILKYQLPSRPYDIRIVQEFYKPHEEKIVIQDSVTYTHTPKLVANYAEVTVDAGNDDNTYIYINEEYKGTSPWRGKLTARTYEVSARKENHNSTEKHVNIVPSDEPQTVKLDSPTPIVGWLKVNCSPTITTVYIDGKEVGESPLLSLPLIIGEHTVVICREGYKDARRSIKIEEGQTLQLNVTLEKQQTSSYGSYSSSTSTSTSTSTVPNKTSLYSSYSEGNTHNEENNEDEEHSTDSSPYSYRPYTSYTTNTSSLQNRSSSNSSTSRSHRSGSSYKPPRASKKYDIYREHQSGVAGTTELFYMLGLDGYPYPSLCWTFTIGNKFNNHFYLGVGSGLNFNLGAGSSTRSYSGYSENDVESPYLKPSLMSIPLFGYMKVNFVNRRCSPFFALSAGGYLAKKQKLILDNCETEYKTSRAFVNPQLGLDIRTSPNKSVFFAVGFQYFNHPYCYDYNDISATIETYGNMGLDIRVGLTF